MQRTLIEKKLEAISSSPTNRIEDIPKKVLKKLNLDIEKTEEGNWTLKSPVEAQDYSSLIEILDQCEGFISFNHFHRAQSVIKGKLKDSSLADRILKRKNELVGAGVPPIYERRFDLVTYRANSLNGGGGHSMIDVILHQFQGNHPNPNYKNQPATISEIKNFSAYAFRDGQLDNWIVREFEFISSLNPHSHVKTLPQLCRLALAELGEKLKGLVQEEKRKKSSEIPKNISRRFWHAKYTAESVTKIVDLVYEQRPASVNMTKFRYVFPRVAPKQAPVNYESVVAGIDSVELWTTSKPELLRKYGQIPGHLIMSERDSRIPQMSDKEVMVAYRSKPRVFTPTGKTLSLKNLERADRLVRHEIKNAIAEYPKRGNLQKWLEVIAERSQISLLRVRREYKNGL